MFLSSFSKCFNTIKHGIVTKISLSLHSNYSANYSYFSAVVSTICENNINYVYFFGSNK